MKKFKVFNKKGALKKACFEFCLQFCFDSRPWRMGPIKVTVSYFSPSILHPFLFEPLRLQSSKTVQTLSCMLFLALPLVSMPSKPQEDQELQVVQRFELRPQSASVAGAGATGGHPGQRRHSRRGSGGCSRRDSSRGRRGNGRRSKGSVQPALRQCRGCRGCRG